MIADPFSAYWLGVLVGKRSREGQHVGEVVGRAVVSSGDRLRSWFGEEFAQTDQVVGGCHQRADQARLPQPTVACAAKR